MFFEVNIKGSAVTHYLLGTMHTRQSSAYTFAELAISKMKNVAIVATEIDLLDPSISKLADAFLLPNHSTLDQLIPPSQFDKMRRHICKVFGVDLFTLRQFIPFYIMSKLIEESISKDHALPLDHYLSQSALAMGKKTAGLESIQDQSDTLSRISMEIQLLQLKKFASNTAVVVQKTSQLAALYSEGNPYTLFKVARSQIGGMRAALLHSRNLKMYDAAISLMQQSATMVAVGAAHLGGNDGLLAHFKRDGHRVTPIQA